MEGPKKWAQQVVGLKNGQNPNLKWGFQQWGYPHSWMVYLKWKILLKWMMIWGTPISGNLQTDDDWG